MRNEKKLQKLKENYKRYMTDKRRLEIHLPIEVFNQYKELTKRIGSTPQVEIRKFVIEYCKRLNNI